MSHDEYAQRAAVLDAMERYGGGFVCRLAQAWRAADEENAAKLRAAFGTYYDKYAAMVRDDAASRAVAGEQSGYEPPRPSRAGPAITRPGYSVTSPPREPGR